MWRHGDRQRSMGWVLTIVGCLAFLVSACNGEITRDQVRRLAAIVWYGAPLGGMPALNDDDWHDLNVGDEVRTDDTGEAELALVNCSGHIYLFGGSATVVAPCRKHDFDYASGQCLQAGFAWFNQVCSGRFVVGTLGAVIQAPATAFSVGYLPEEQLTLVMVFDGEVTVQPVLDVDSDTVAEEEIPVKAGQFLYTISGPVSPEIAGIPARQPLPVTELRPLADALGIQPWLEDVARRAKEDDLLPPDWPSGEEPPEPVVTEPPDEPVEPGPVAISLGSGGGPLEDSYLQKILLTAINKDAAIEASFPGQEITFTTRLGNSEVDARLVAYDPEVAQKMLVEADYPDGFNLQLVYPEGDEQLARLAAAITGDLRKAGIGAERVVLPANEVRTYVKTALSAGQPVVWLERR